MVSLQHEYGCPGLPVVPAYNPRNNQSASWAFALMGIHEYLQRFAGDRCVTQVQEELANRLLALYQNNQASGWNWFERGLTYCNAALSHAMLLSGDSLPNLAMTETGLESLRWLADLQRSDTGSRHFLPIGSNGFYQQGGERASFDQQPVEAQSMVSA